MAYNELVKNFERVRAYMREFYVYGFKSRSEYDAKSARSYDDERRRIESWLGEYMRFTQTADGKNVFLSIDSRVIGQNPFHKAWKAKSFTDKDITLHFILFDILCSPDVKMTSAELMEAMEEYLEIFDEPMNFDESTVRKKLKEYVGEGIIRTEKQGRNVLYSRAESVEIEPLTDAIAFFTEAAPCGVVGSFLQDKQRKEQTLFQFKHHYMTQAVDSDVMAVLFDAMQQKRRVSLEYHGKRSAEPMHLHVVPLRIFISVQNGRQNLLAYHDAAGGMQSYRLDNISNVKLEEVDERFDALRDDLEAMERHMWGVNSRRGLTLTEHVEFEIYAAPWERHIVQRLEREKRCGRVEQIDEQHYRFVAEVFDSLEMLPWIRTFIGRITKMNFSNQTASDGI